MLKGSLRASKLTRALLFSVLLSLLFVAPASRAQNAGSPHDADLFGVRVGMDVPAALEAVFVNAKRQPGQEKPDAKKAEGKDVRVLYKLKEGNLQIIFADGKRVKEIQFEYATPLRYEDLRLLDSSHTYDNMRGDHYDDRYAVGFTDDRLNARHWWRDEKTPEGYRIRISFISGMMSVPGAHAPKEIRHKIISVVPEDKDKFAKTSASG
ncbi:MAG: hypothetical protein H0T60_00645 [Acidobacteria bacterium]|nr:hypothetical protein [Acidobacteriota bacterium]